MRTQTSSLKTISIKTTYSCPHCKKGYALESKAIECRAQCEYKSSFDKFLDDNKVLLDSITDVSSPETCFNIFDKVLRKFVPITKSENNGLKLSFEGIYYRDDAYDDSILDRIDLKRAKYSFSFIVPNTKFDYKFFESMDYEYEGRHKWIKNYMMFLDFFNEKTYRISSRSSKYDKDHALLTISFSTDALTGEDEDNQEFLTDLSKKFRKYNKDKYIDLKNKRREVFKRNWFVKDELFLKNCEEIINEKNELKFQAQKLSDEIGELQRRLDKIKKDILDKKDKHKSLYDARLVDINVRTDKEIKTWKFENYDEGRKEIIKDVLSNHLEFTDENELIKESIKIKDDLNDIESLFVNKWSYDDHRLDHESKKESEFKKYTELGKINQFVKFAKDGKATSFLKLINSKYGTIEEVRTIDPHLNKELDN